MLWPEGKLFSPSGVLGVFKHPKVSGSAGSSVVIVLSRLFSYFSHSRLLSPLVCMAKLAWLGTFELWVNFFMP